MVIDFKKFKGALEIEAYATELFVRCKKLTEENISLREKINHLQNLLGDIPSQLTTQPLSDEEFICINELKKIKALSEERILTFEETRKTETYSKLLLGFKQKDKKKDLTDSLSAEALLNIIDEPDKQK